MIRTTKINIVRPQKTYLPSGTIQSTLALFLSLPRLICSLAKSSPHTQKNIAPYKKPLLTV